MVFSSNEFLFAFFPITLILYFNPLAKTIKYKNLILLFMSIAFYAWGEPVFVFVMIFFSFINWYLGLLIERKKELSKIIVIITVVIDLSLLVIFKYLTFIMKNIAYMSGNDSFLIDIVLPIGISFYIFQMMSYIFDVANGKAVAQKRFSDLLMYISMFPQLIAGPIVRYKTVALEINNRKTTTTDFSVGICRFIKGLTKKVIIANNLALLSDSVFIYEIENLSVMTAWIGAISYTLQIYFDFSGYSDMAIGLGRVFGFHFSENFEHPYCAGSITEFWRKWHISMGTWFRDYVYFPLGGSRVKSRCRLVFNLFVVWVLTGVWHGANWTFLLWGIMYFILLSIEKLTGINKKMNWMGHIWTMFFVIIGWVIFRSDTVTYSLDYIKVMLGNPLNVLVDGGSIALLRQYWTVILLGIILSVVDVKKYKINNSKLFFGSYIIVYCLMILLSVSAVIKGGNDPFIYFNF